MATHENTRTDSARPTANWSQLLNEAVSKPGLLLKAYNAFHTYSVGNQILAMQCGMRGIDPGPLNTYPGWQALGRHVKKGERALMLCMPLTRKSKDRVDENGEPLTYTHFAYKNNWFALSQTEGDEYTAPEIPNWSKVRALETLGITETPFDLTNGNVQGYARKKSIAVSPLAALPHKTVFHELAHVVLGHTTEADFSDTELTPRSLREVEAESVALILCETLEIEGGDYCRGYIQNWLKGDVIPEQSAQRIFRAADQVLKAGCSVVERSANA